VGPKLLVEHHPHRALPHLGEYVFVLFMAPVSQALELPTIPVRFKIHRRAMAACNLVDDGRAAYEAQNKEGVTASATLTFMLPLLRQKLGSRVCLT
jgi:hypothetical protein